MRLMERKYTLLWYRCGLDTFFLRIPDQNGHGKCILRVGDIQSAAVPFRHLPHAGQAQSVGGGVRLIGCKGALFFQDGISFGIGDFVSKIAVFRYPRFDTDVPVLRSRDLQGSFYGIVQGVGKKAAEAYGIDADQFPQVDMEETVDFVFQHLIVFGIQHGVDDAVFAEHAVSHRDLRLQLLQIPVGVLQASGVK